MGIFSTIINGITKVAEFVVGTVAAAIATPTVGTVVAAVATVGAVIGGAYLIYKGVSYVVNKCDQYITYKCNPDEVSTRFMLPGAKTRDNAMNNDDIAADVATAVCSSNSTSGVYTKRYSIDDDVIGETFASVKPRSHKRKDKKSKAKRARDYRIRSSHSEKSLKSSAIDVPFIEVADDIKREDKPKKKKLSLKKIRDVAEAHGLLKEDGRYVTPDEYLDSLPFMRSNITCIC